jgi:hypothetical protein
VRVALPPALPGQTEPPNVPRRQPGLRSDRAWLGRAPVWNRTTSPAKTPSNRAFCGYRTDIWRKGPARADSVAVGGVGSGSELSAHPTGVGDGSVSSDTEAIRCVEKHRLAIPGSAPRSRSRSHRASIRFAGMNQRKPPFPLTKRRRSVSHGLAVHKRATHPFDGFSDRRSARPFAPTSLHRDHLSRFPISIGSDSSLKTRGVSESLFGKCFIDSSARIRRIRGGPGSRSRRFRRATRISIE